MNVDTEDGFGCHVRNILPAPVRGEPVPCITEGFLLYVSLLPPPSLNSEPA